MSPPPQKKPSPLKISFMQACPRAFRSIRCIVLGLYLRCPLGFFLILILLNFIKIFNTLEHSLHCFRFRYHGINKTFVSFFILILLVFAKTFVPQNIRCSVSSWFMRLPLISFLISCAELVQIYEMLYDML